MASVISSAPPSIVVLSGSSRSGSYNMALARIARNMVEDAGGQADLVDLAAHLLPVYDFDLQARSGLPAGVMALKALFTAADGAAIAFDAEGGLAAEAHTAAMLALVGKLVQTAKALPQVRTGQAPTSGA